MKMADQENVMGLFDSPDGKYKFKNMKVSLSDEEDEEDEESNPTTSKKLLYITNKSENDDNNLKTPYSNNSPRSCENLIQNLFQIN